jgi:hypothetical protein
MYIKRIYLYKQLVTLIAIGAIILLYIMAVIEHFGPATFGSDYPESARLLSFANRIAMLTLLINGTLINSSKFKYMKIALGVAALGGILKIIHSPGGNEAVILGRLAIVIIYVLHFCSKPRHSIFDILKLLTVVILLTPLGLGRYYPALSHAIELTGDLLCVITFVYFLITQRDRYLKDQNS